MVSNLLPADLLRDISINIEASHNQSAILIPLFLALRASINANLIGCLQLHKVLVHVILDVDEGDGCASKHDAKRDQYLFHMHIILADGVVVVHSRYPRCRVIVHSLD